MPSGLFYLEELSRVDAELPLGGGEEVPDDPDHGAGLHPDQLSLPIQ